jgi:GT2 family glycosyltransferase
LEEALGATYTQVVQLTAFGNRSGENIGGCNSAYRKKALIDVGGFNEKLVTAEETELHYRIFRNGGKIFYDQNMVVLHFRRGNFRSFFKQFYRYGLGKANMIREHPEKLGLSDVVAFLPFFYLPFLFLLVFLNPILGFDILMYTIILLGVIILVLSIILNIKAKRQILFHLVFYALILYAVAESIGHLVGILRRNKHK